MTDLHCHILPGIDDGSPDVATSLELLRREKADDIGTIVFTPHFNFERQTVDGFLESRQASYEKLMPACENEGLRFNFRLGAEVFFSPVITQMDMRPLCFTGTDCLLVEFPFTHYPAWAAETFYDLRTRGITPILAHIERYPYLFNRPELLFDLANSGVLLQVNATSLVKHPKARKKIFLYMKHNLVHLLATDTHMPTKRPPLMRAGLAEVQKGLGEAFANRLTLNANDVVSGTPVDVLAPTEIRELFGIRY